MKNLHALSALLTLLATSPALAETAKLQRLDIVDRAIAHHGGELYSNSEIELQMCSKSGCSDLRTRVEGGLFDLEAAADMRGDRRRVRITNDSVEWDEAGARQTFDADRAQGLRDWVMARVYFTFLPFRLNDESVYKQDLGLESWDGRELHKVKVTFTPGSSTHAQDEYLYWFDPESARLEQFAYSYATDGGGLRFRRLVRHRRIGGILFFGQENFGTEGPDLSVDLVTPAYAAGLRHVSTIELRDIKVRPLR